MLLYARTLVLCGQLKHHFLHQAWRQQSGNCRLVLALSAFGHLYKGFALCIHSLSDRLMYAQARCFVFAQVVVASVVALEQGLLTVIISLHVPMHLGIRHARKHADSFLSLDKAESGHMRNLSQTHVHVQVRPCTSVTVVACNDGTHACEVVIYRLSFVDRQRALTAAVR